jgi:hypothetical protein
MAARPRHTLRWVLVVLVVLFVIAQFVPVDRSNPPSDPRQSLIATAAPPPPVAAALERSCRDCHSNETRWPWYSRVAPASWLLARDVSEGRSHLNFSEWATLDNRRRTRRLEEVCEEITAGAMPKSSYLLIHPAARLAPGEITAICDWTREEIARLSPPGPRSR